MTFTRAKITEPSIQEFDEIITKKIFDPKFKGVLEIRAQTLNLHVIATGKSYKDRILNERLFYDLSGMWFLRNCKFYESFNHKIRQMIAAGLISHYKGKNRDAVKSEQITIVSKSAKEGPKILTIQHLEAGFVISFFGFLISTLVFMLELIYKTIEVKLKESLSTTKQKQQSFKVSQNCVTKPRLKPDLNNLKMFDVRNISELSDAETAPTEKLVCQQLKGNKLSISLQQTKL